MVAAGIADLYQSLRRGVDNEPTVQIETEFGFVQFLWRTIRFGVEHLLIVVQRGSGMPEAELRRGNERGIDAILMVEVDGLEDAYLLLFIVHSADMGKEIVLTGEARDKGQPRIGQVEIDTLTYRRAQQRIAALIEHTAVVHDYRTQHIVGRTGDTLAVAELCAPLALLPCNRKVGEPVVIGAAGFFLPFAKRIVICFYMLKAKTGIQVPKAQLHLVFSKSGNVSFSHLVVSFWYNVFLIDISTITNRVCSLRSATQYAFPYGISQHQLACHHTAVFHIKGSDGAVAKFFTILLLVKMVFRYSLQYRGV